jgi:hypothetical protein
MIAIIFLMLALVFFLMAAIQVVSPRVNLTALGLVFLTLFFLVPLFAHTGSIHFGR